jgi:putative transposase
MVFQILNQGVGRRTLFEKPADYLAFERVVDETLRVCRMRIWAYCWMPNRWHFIMWPEHDGDLSMFMQQFTNVHVKRSKQHYHESHYGHLDQRRFESFPVQTNDSFYQVTRYVERNALRASLVERAEACPWSKVGCGKRSFASFSLTSDWPLNRPKEWLEIVNRTLHDAELAALWRCVNRRSPLGDDLWSSEIEQRLELESTKRVRGRPRKDEVIKSS